MTVNELRDFLAKYTGEGKGDALVTVCHSLENPLTDSLLIKDVVFLETKNGNCEIVLQTV